MSAAPKAVQVDAFLERLHPPPRYLAKSKLGGAHGAAAINLPSFR
jgi:hypothetical protein